MARWLLLSMLVFLLGPVARADEILYRYEGDVLPYDPAAGWVIADPCPEPECQESVDSGIFEVRWQSGDTVNYHYWIAQPPTPSPEPPFWVEWRFASSSPKPTTQSGCDGRANLVFWQLGDVVYVHGDAAVSFEGGDVVSGLELEQFYTLRFETMDGLNYTFALDGQVFMADIGQGTTPRENPYLQFGGHGACQFGEKWNKWDYIRFGHISEGESIVSASPPAGYLDPDDYTGIDRFTVTFDQPGYVHIDDIAVTVSGGEAPVVTKTTRRDGYGPQKMEIVLDRPLTVGETTTFSFAGLDPDADTVSYTLAVQIPASSHFTILLGFLALVVAAALIHRRRFSTDSLQGPKTETPGP